MHWTKKQLDLWFWFSGPKITEHLRGLPYEEYLKSPYWDSVRNLVWKRAEGRCENHRCGGAGARIHHKSHEHRGEEHRYLEDLRLLCEDCYTDTQQHQDRLMDVLGPALTERLLHGPARVSKPQ